MKLPKRKTEISLPSKTRIINTCNLFLSGVKILRKEGIRIFYIKLKEYTRQSNIFTLKLLLEKNESKTFLFISGCPGDSMRYRCEHQSEQLKVLGIKSDIKTFNEIELNKVIPKYKVFILHRVPCDENIEEFISEVKDKGKCTIFDTDDLVFNPDLDPIYINPLSDMSEMEKEKYYNDLIKYRRTLLLSDYVVVSTDYLKKEAELLHPKVFVNRNSVSNLMVETAEKVKCKKNLSSRESVIVGYMSGTPTHNKDFVECKSALLSLLSENPNVFLKIIGYLDLSDDFKKFEKQIIRVPLVPWQDLPSNIQTFDINLAPLEMNNPFTQSKSELKFMESGLLAVPTIASEVGGFTSAIKDGENGFLANTSEEWYSKLKALVTTPDLRAKIGNNAQDTILNDYTSLARKRNLEAILNNVEREKPIEILRNE
jgi:O-antigen biosynthesis protein